MGGGSKAGASGESSRIRSLVVQSSSLGVTLPKGWGTGRVKCNLIWYADFKAISHVQKQGGKGGAPKQTTYTYSASVILAIAEGTITSVKTVYRDKESFTGGSAMADAGLSLATGGTTQPTWGYLTSNHPTEALNYSGIAYAYASNYPLTDSASIQNHSFEVEFPIKVSGKPDANPRDIVVDFFTNPASGVPGWPSGFLANWDDYSNYCLAANLLLSPVLQSQTPASEFITDIMNSSNSDVFWSEGLVKIKPRGDETITGNGVTWVPDLTPIYELTASDFKEMNEQKAQVLMSLVDQTEAFNITQIEYLDRSQQYSPAIATAKDLANITEYGERKEDPRTLHSICDPVIAQAVAELWKTRLLYIREKYAFKLSWQFVLLEVGDYVSLTTTDELGLNRTLVRILSIEEDEDQLLSFTAEGVPAGTGAASIYPAHVSNGYVADTGVAPGDVTAPSIINAPTSLTNGVPEIWINASSTDPNWGGCQLWSSVDGVNYAFEGIIPQRGRYGVLTTTLSSHADPDLSGSFGVDLSNSRGELLSVGDEDRDTGTTLSIIGNEIISYRDATLTGSFLYTISSLRRGLYGTSPAAHAVGAHYTRLDNINTYKLRYPNLGVGAPTWFKFLSYNLWGLSIQSLADVTAYTFTADPVIIPGWGIDGNSAVVPYLTNEAATVAADSSGVVPSFAGLGGAFIVMDGSIDVTASCTFSVVSTTDMSITINSAGVYAPTAMTADNASAVLRATYNGNPYDKEYTLSKSIAGGPGESAKLLVVISDRQTVTYDSLGVITPSTQTTTFTAQKQNTTVSPVWTVTDAAGTYLDASSLTGGTVYQNLMWNSQNIAGWDNVGIVTVTSNTTIAPDGSLTADTATDSSAIATAVAINGIRFPTLHTPTALINYYYSACFLKTTGAITFPAVYGTIDDVGGGGVTRLICIDTNTGQVSPGATVLDCGYYWRVLFTVISGNTSGPGESFSLYPAYGYTSAFGVNNVAATGSCVSWGYQVTLGAQVSYIPTTTALRTGVLSPDPVTLTAANFETARGSTPGVIVTADIFDTGGYLTDRISILKVQDGSTGVTGNFSDIQFIRSSSTPATPTSPSPAGWSDGVPAGSTTLWMIRANKDSTGALIGGWTTPQAITGLSFLGAYNAAQVYYVTNTVTYNGGTYVATMTTTAGQAPTGTAQANTQWDVIAAPGPAGTPAVPPSSFGTSGTPVVITVPGGAGLQNLRTLADAAGYTGLSAAYIQFNATSSITAAAGGRGIDTGTWPSASYTISLALAVSSGVTIWGGGGGGGDGGDYTHAGAGSPGGDAIYCQENITITNSGTIRGGSGGGGGGGKYYYYNSGAGEWFVKGGGGGGGGAPNGGGAPGGITDDGGPDGGAGSAGTTGGGGAGGSGSGSAGNGGAGGGTSANAGSAGSGGTSPGAGGAAGYAVRKNGKTVTATGGTIQGSVA